MSRDTSTGPNWESNIEVEDKVENDADVIPPYDAFLREYTLPLAGSPGAKPGSKGTLALLLFTPAFRDTAYYNSPRGWQSAVESLSDKTELRAKYEVVQWLYRAVETASAVSVAALNDPRRVNSEVDMLFMPVGMCDSTRLINDMATMLVLDHVLHALSPSTPVQHPIMPMNVSEDPEPSHGIGAYDEQLNLVKGNNWVHLLARATAALLDAKEFSVGNGMDVS